MKQTQTSKKCHIQMNFQATSISLSLSSDVYKALYLLLSNPETDYINQRRCPRSLRSAIIYHQSALREASSKTNTDHTAVSRTPSLTIRKAHFTDYGKIFEMSSENKSDQNSFIRLLVLLTVTNNDRGYHSQCYFVHRHLNNV